MAVYAIGDVQGCYDELRELLDKLKFDPAADQAWFVGDLVNRGPKSLATLRFVRDLGDAAVCVLGNHDLHLLALLLTKEPRLADDAMPDVQRADDRFELADWLRAQPLAHYDKKLKTLMVHAGVPPQWTLDATLEHAATVEAILRGKKPQKLLKRMYGATPNIWSDELEGYDRLRFIVNALTRIRFCTAAGKLDFKAKLAPGMESRKLIPWFDLPERQIRKTRIVFGHWSTLGYHEADNVLGLDTGCVWGGRLTAERLDAFSQPVQVKSRQPRKF
ncbi:MAG: symmetrical bis(5'-nucleosyl)-tetraphosphatase [Gammaproteobacteria bacterium]|jgi:bis(5'-nucleosyl)-tetraphosphatase (symmetrical)|nr:symmetrical bis(5'-nucleosyl)-tetraphosphatase [Gammaproteobacteria bacterium]